MRRILTKSSPGSGTEFGADDIDQINQLLTGVDQSSTDPVDINTQFRFRDNKLYLRNPANTFSYIVRTSALAANRDITLPLLTGPDTFTFNSFAATLANKILDAARASNYLDFETTSTPANPGSGVLRLYRNQTTNVLTVRKNDGTVVDLESGGGGGGTVSIVEAQSYTIFIDPTDGSYKARNGKTGAIDFSHASDVGAVLASIFNSVSTTTPLFIAVAPGDYTIKSWDEPSFRHSNVTIKGAGSDVTSFTVSDEVKSVAADNGVFSFIAVSNQYTSIALASNATIDDWRVLTNATTDLVAGCHVLIGSNFDIPNAAAATPGEHNRVVKIVATGGSPSQRIILEKNTRYAYNTADSAFIRRIDFLENIHLEGFTIKSNGSPAQNIIFQASNFNYNLHMRDIHFKDWAQWQSSPSPFHYCMVHTSVVNSTIEECIFEQSPERGHAAGSDPENVVGYAISIRSACETVRYMNCYFMGMIRHCCTTTTGSVTVDNGMPTNIYFIDCNAESNTEAAYDTHEEGKDIYFINCSTYSNRKAGGTDSAKGGEDTDGFNTRCNYTHYINCSVTNCNGQGFSHDAGTVGHTYTNCRVRSLYGTATRTGLNINGTNIRVDGFDAADCEAPAIDVGANATNVTMSNINIRNVCTGDNTLIPFQISGTNVSLSNVTLDTSNSATIVPMNITGSNVTLNGVHLVGAGKDITVTGMNVGWDHNSCTGRQLSKQRYKIGRFEGSPSVGGGLFDSTVLTVTNGSKRVEGTDGTFQEFSLSTLNQIGGVVASTHTERDQNPYIRFTYRLEHSAGLRFFAGWNSTTTIPTGPAADPLVNNSGIMIKLDTSVDSNLKIYHNSGDATTTTGAVIAATDTNKHVFELRANNGSSGFQWRYDYGAWSSVITTDIPAAATDLGMQIWLENNESTVTKTLNVLEVHTEVAQK